jgi:DNA modification methylase
MLRNQSALLNWGLRDYGTAKWEGGDEGCDHSPLKRGSRFATPVSSKQASNTGSGSISDRECPCGAIRKDSQLGLEKTPEEYVASMVAVFREVRRVLKKDGVLWLNLGDSYCGSTSETPSKRENSPIAKGTVIAQETRNGRGDRTRSMLNIGIKPKDLVGIPWRIAFALQADGWYLRSDIIWAKPNPMPESITDRPTKAHEYIFLLTKSAKYYYNAEAIREISDSPGSIHVHRNGMGTKANDRADDPRFATRPKATFITPDFRNRRTVWSIPTQPYSGAHFATFPEEIPRLCILAGSRPGDYILDPFGGSGTTGKVALELGRKPIHLDIGYFDLARKRMSVTPAMAGLMG